MQNLLFKSSIFIIVLIIACAPLAGEGTKKKVITSADQLPKHTYRVTVDITTLVTDAKVFNPFAARVREDIEQELDAFEIRDLSTVKDYIDTLVSLDFLAGNLEAGQRGLKKRRTMEKKAGARLLSGLPARIMIATAQTVKPGSREFQKAFARNLEKELNKLPWQPIQEALIHTRGEIAMNSRNFQLGTLKSMLGPTIKKTGFIPAAAARLVIKTRYLLEVFEPVREQVLSVYGKVIAAKRIVKPDIWAERNVSFTGKEGYNPVTIAIWDLGLDTSVYPDRLFVNPNEKKDGRDNDGNGYIDDIHGIAYDMKSRPVPEILYTVPGKDMRKELYIIKGYNAITNSLDWPEGKMFRQRLETIDPDHVQKWWDELMDVVFFMHGTHVAGIAIEGNPYARILTGRITMDNRQLPDPPDRAQAKRTAKMYKDVVNYFNTNGVRVVNMSWALTYKRVKAQLSANGIGKTAKERAEIADGLYNIMAKGFEEAVKSAPNILFVVAAGNSDTDPEFLKEVPTSLNVPNLLVAGAVDQAGDRTPFTCFGKLVDIYSKGAQVESFLPGGERMAASGTSMASPNVVNLAAKLLAVDPSLTAVELKQLIIKGADRKQKENFLLMNPERSLELLLATK